MKKMDKDGLLLCDLQGETFELSTDLTSTSSEIFVRRFMNSKTAKMIDGKDILQTNLQARDIIDLVLAEYKDSIYGSIKYNKDEMYWVGYFYRYFSYTYELSSNRVYKIDKPKELRDLFLLYHTLSLEQAIKRVQESKGLKSDFEKDINRQFEIYER